MQQICIGNKASVGSTLVISSFQIGWSFLSRIDYVPAPGVLVCMHAIGSFDRLHCCTHMGTGRAWLEIHAPPKSQQSRSHFAPTLHSNTHTHANQQSAHTFALHFVSPAASLESVRVVCAGCVYLPQPPILHC
jgi:hypothetical protein